MLPRARQEAPRNRRISNDGKAARQAELSAVRVAAEHEGIAELLGLLIGFRAMAQARWRCPREELAHEPS